MSRLKSNRSNANANVKGNKCVKELNRPCMKTQKGVTTQKRSFVLAGTKHPTFGVA